MTVQPAGNSSTSLATLQADLLHKIDGRLRQLNKLESSVESDTTLSAADKAELEQELQHQITGLTDLRSHAANDTTEADLRADAHSMIVDYRVWKVMSPKVSTVESMDAAQHQLDTLEAQLQANPSATHATEAQQALDAATAALAGKHDALMGLMPHDYAQDMFTQFINAVNSANTDLTQASNFLAQA
jgi:hypothetical protein